MREEQGSLCYLKNKKRKEVIEVSRIFLVFLLMFILLSGKVEEKDIQSDNLINAQQFLDENYFQAFLEKAQAANEQKRKPLDKYLLSWIPSSLKCLGGQEEEINGSSEKFAMMLAPVPLNDD